MCALTAAMTWALALIFFRKSGERIHPLALNLFKNVVGIVMILIALVILEALGAADFGFDTSSEVGWRQTAPASDYYLLIISGFLGIAIADTLLFKCLNLVGVSMFVIVECTYSPITLLVAWWVLAEKIEWPHIVGGILILIAILLTVKARPPADRTRQEIFVGFVLGILYIFLMAIGIVLAKPVFTTDRFPLLEATVLRLIAGTVALALMAAASPKRRELFGVFRPTRYWKYTFPGALLGGFLSMVFWIAGFKYTETGIAAILNQTSVVFAAVFAVIFLREHISRRKLISIALAFAGVLLVRLGPSLSRQIEAVMHNAQ
ncbi:MAG: DMT family transporter [Phycisphaerales bacterium]|nr:DMT family transporter [Phycisphaerales bacterium]MCB9864096.1 DMT family transporter [Phycisphaerales bacterium]